MVAYISVSLHKRSLLKNQLSAISETLTTFGIKPLIFVDKYKFDLSQEKDMMAQAMLDIDNADILIAEASTKAIGVGVEVGYAKAKNKPVIYIRHHDAEHSTTISGMSDFNIVYVNAEDLQKKLMEVVSENFVIA
jgi:nucleoside 2-deoxyribosyltransferase